MTQKSDKRRSKRWIIVAGVVGIVGVGGIAAIALTSQKSAQGYLADAQAQVQKGELSAALIQLRNAVQKEPTNPAARYQLAVVSLRAGDAVSAEKEAKIALERGFSEDSALPVLAAAYLDQGKFQLLLDTIPEGSRSREAEGEIRALRGMAFLGLRDIPAAERSFKSVLAIDPRKLRAEIGLARVDALRQDLKSAEARLDKVLAQEPSAEVAGEAYVLKGQLRRMDKDIEGALQVYGKLLDMTPGNLRARIERAQILIEQNQADRASPDVRYVLDRVPNHPVATHLQAWIFLQKNNETAAYDLLQRQGTGLARYAPNLLMMGRLQLNRNQSEAAQTNLAQYLQAVPNNIEARLFLANLVLRKDLPDQAITILRGAPAASADDVRVLRMLASASLRAGRVNEAGAWLDKAAAASTDTKTRTQVAIDRVSLGQTDAAIKELDNAIELDPKAGDAKILLVVTHLRQGQFDEAERVAKSLQIDNPTSPIPDNLLGGVNMARGDRDAARKNFEAALEKKSDFLAALTNLAKLDIADRKFEDAVRRYTSIHEQNPKNIEAMIALAELEQRLGHPEQAVTWLTKAISVDPNAVAPRLTMVNLLLVQRDNAKAMTAARELRKLDPDNADAIDAMARVQILSGDAAGAADTYRSLIATSPTPASHERLAQILLASGDTAGAKTALRNGIAANPDAANLVGELTSLLQRTGEGEEALKVAKEWQAKHPKSFAGDLIAANILALQGNYKDAASAAEQAYGKEQSSVTAIALAKTRLTLGDGAGAASGLQEFLKSSPKDAPARELLASLHISARQYDKAITESEEVLKVQPANPIVLNNLAWLYSQKRDPRALEYAERAHASAPNAPAILDTLGYILVQKGDIERGLPLLRKAYDDSKKAPEIGYHLAVALEKSGQAGEARSLLEAVLNNPASFDEKAEAKKLFDSIPAR